ncbi:hypothetical protein MasN3_05510 [Massilia varians]|uniref:Uncharacterized protein n=1 Tax=Massilia varians TaxID=457921 RepID=A0ABN6T4F1_9BURK|nr:hypothetical protein MasN3_05510 [Massilia varians]
MSAISESFKAGANVTTYRGENVTWIACTVTEGIVEVRTQNRMVGVMVCGFGRLDNTTSEGVVHLLVVAVEAVLVIHIRFLIQIDIMS